MRSTQAGDVGAPVPHQRSCVSALAILLTRSHGDSLPLNPAGERCAVPFTDLRSVREL